MSTSRPTITIVHVYPMLLGLYGDRGNALVLQARARARGFDAELLSIAPGDPVPASADAYLIGGGEDIAQTAATTLLRDDGNFAAAASRGAVVLAVCAGLQVLGTEFAAAGGRVAGLGLVDAVTTAGAPRAVGELLTRAIDLDVPLLTGFENHAGRTTLGPGVAPLGRVMAGIGNGIGATDGYVAGHIVGTYLHGPVLARNPALADLLLHWATGETMEPLDDRTVESLRSERLAAAQASTAPASTFNWRRRRR